MAIIYTYPRLNNPDGTELIVVSETKNKNSTRLITLAGICEFCDETSCDHSFRNVQTSSLTPAQAVGCNDTLILTSSDASVTITNAGNTIDFKSSGGGPSGCPTTYVLKPVSCNTETGEAICTIDEDARNWIFTCESSLSAVTPGYVKLSNNGSPVTIPIDEEELRDCWYSDVWSPIPTGLESCEECCAPPADPVIRGTNCENGEILFEALQSSISGPAGWETAIDNDCEFGQFTGGEAINCIKLTTAGTDDGSTPILDSIKSLPLGDCGCECCLYECSFIMEPCPGDPPASHDPLAGAIVAPDEIRECESLNTGDVVNVTFEEESWCYTLTKVCIEPSIPVTMALVTDCEDEACEAGEPGRRYRNCNSEIWYGEDQEDPIPYPADGIVYAGDPTSSECVSISCCVEIETVAVPPEPLAWTDYLGANECVEGISVQDDCTCCTNFDVARYSRCNEDCIIEGYETVNIDVCAWGKSLDVPQDWKPTPGGGAPQFIKIDIGGGILCCYEFDQNICEFENLFETGLDYSSLSYDDSWSTCEDCASEEVIYIKYDNCDDPTGDKWVSSTGTVGSETWAVGQIIKQGGNCYEVLENPSVLDGPLVELPGFIAYSTPEVDCECCTAGPNREYQRCGSEDLIVVDPSAWAALNESSIDNNIKGEVAATPGKFVCYQFTQCTSDVPTGGFSDFQISTGCDDTDCTPLIQLTSCDGAYTEVIALSDLNPAADSLALMDVIEVTAGPLASLSSCWDVTSLSPAGPATQVGVNNWSGPIAGNPDEGLDACDCCEQDLRLYTICDDAAGVTCDASASSVLLIDVALVPGWDALTYAVAQCTDSTTGITCCYQLNEEIPSCQTPTGVINGSVAECGDEESCTFI